MNETHIYDWLDSPATDPEEKNAKEWLNRFTLPAIEKHKGGHEKWLSRHKLTVVWRCKRYQCTGASRMGDVWLKSRGSKNYYDHRVNVDELSDWKRVMLR